MNKQELQNKIEDLEKQFAEVKEQVNSLEFEGIKKGVRQRPKVIDVYFFMDSCGDIESEYWSNHPTDLFRFNTGNCFKTKQEAEEYKENLLIKQQLKDLALELNNGVEIDWENGEQDKYYIHINNNFKPIYLGYDPYHINIGQIYCLNGDFLKIAKDRIGEEKLIKLIKSGV